MQNSLTKSAYLFFIALLVLPYHAFSTNLYVSSIGSNTSNTCTSPGTPCATITYALTQATAGDVIIASGNLTAENAGIIITKSITLRGEQFNVKPVLDASFNPTLRGAGNETQLTFDAGEYILIQNGVNNVTIEGFEFKNTADAAGDAIIMFAAGGTNNNIVIHRNILTGTPTERRRLIYKANDAGNLTNIKVTENRILGSGGSFTVAVIDIRKAGTGTNEIRGNIIGTSQPTYQTQKGIELSNVTNFIIAENEFRSIVASPIQIISIDAGGNVIIELNTFTNSNMGGFINESGLNSPIAAGILLRANTINNTASLIIRNNDFQGNNKFAIAIPAANNSFTTNGIQIIENKFSTSNSAGNNANADLYVGNDVDNPFGKILTDGNWWGHSVINRPNSLPATGGAAPGGSVTSDIFGSVGAPVGARGKVFPSVWLKNDTDLNGTLPGFVSDKVVTVDPNPSNLQKAFDAIPEGWTFYLHDYIYTGSFTITKTSFTLDGETNNIAFDNLEINAPGKIITLNKLFSICNSCDGLGSGSLTLTDGKIQLGGYNLMIKDAASVIGGNENSYVITNGSGKLIQTAIGDYTNFTGTKYGDVNFPVGPDEISYTPVIINNNVGSQADDFSVNVQTGISPDDNNGDLVTTNAVDLTWDISEVIPGGSDVTLTLQWNGDPVSGNELTFFDRTKSYITHYNGTIWENLEWPATAAINVPATDFWTQTADHVTTFSPFAVAGPTAALPVELLTFNAELQQSDILLSWATASETDNDYFAIERSADGKTFSEIGKLDGKGTVKEFNNYTFTDEFATETGHVILYYRLKQVDTDGAFTYSKTQDVTLPTWTVRLFPNPANQFINITSPGTTYVQVINSQGKIVLQKEFNGTTAMNISMLTKGIYIFRLSTGNYVSFKKVSIL